MMNKHIFLRGGPGLYPMPFPVGFLVVKVALEQAFLWILRFSLVHITAPMLHVHSSATDAI